MPSEPFLNLAAFLKNTEVVGPGMRDALWVQGCSIRCPGCFNSDYFDPAPRRITPVRQILAHFSRRVGQIDGLSVLGGEPTEQAEPLAELLAGIQDLGLTTVVFTGKLYENLRDGPDSAIHRLLTHTDLLIDGPFVQRLASPHLRWRGSSNQRLIYLSDRLRNSMQPILQDESVMEQQTDQAVSGEIMISPGSLLLHGVGLVPLQLLNSHGAKASNISSGS